MTLAEVLWWVLKTHLPSRLPEAKTQLQSLTSDTIAKSSTQLIWFALINNKYSPPRLLSQGSCEIRCCGVHVATSGSPVAVSRRLWGGSDRREDDASLSLGQGHSFRRLQGVAARTRWTGERPGEVSSCRLIPQQESPRMWVLLRAQGRPRS